MQSRIFKNKKAQVSDAISWLVATLVIIVLLGISLYAASILAETKTVSYSDNSRSEDIVMENSIFAYFQIQNQEEKETAIGFLRDADDSGLFYGNFGESFREINSGVENG